MQNTGRNQFDFDVFKAAYDSDPRLQSIVTNFDNEKIELKTSELDDVSGDAKQAGSTDTVGDMAKNATDLG
tara:strand:- start:551 stop:763 length:213 start_codon:yes stop_codon:yes gene_type:complete